MHDDKTGGSFRTKKLPFTQVSNSALRDISLSLKAKGLYSLIQSYITIPGFILYKKYLINVCTEKEKAFNSAWKELKNKGYLKQYRIPKGKNDSFVYEYDLLDVADTKTPSLINLNKYGYEITNTKNEISHTPHIVPYANSTICETQPMLNVEDINNTDINNTNINNIKSKSSCQSHTKEEPDITTTIDNNIQTQFGLIKIKKEAPNHTDQSDDFKSPFLNNYITKYDYNTYKILIQENIEYNNFLHNYKSEIELIDELINCMLDVIFTKTETVKINGEVKNRNLVINQYLRINFADIRHILDRYKGQHHKITHLHSYLKTMLYTVKQENSHYYTNTVRSDGLVW